MSLNDGDPLIGVEYADPEAPPYMCQALVIQFGSSGQVGGQWSSGGSNTVGTAVTPTQGVMSSFLITYDTVLTSTVVLYQSGAQVASNGLGTGPSTSATSTICLNTGNQGSNRIEAVSCNIACIWNRALSAAEAAQIDVDPYAFLIPAEGEMPALSLAAAPALAVSSPLLLGPKRLRGPRGPMLVLPKTAGLPLQIAPPAPQGGTLPFMGVG